MNIKTFGLLNLLFIFFVPCFANNIDSLKTEEDIFAFLQPFFKELKIDGGFQDYYNETIQVANSLNVRNWVKTDIDNNGKTDLLVFRASSDNLPDIFAILTLDEGYIKVIADYWCKYQFIYPVVTKVNNENVILLYNQEQIDYDSDIQKFVYTELSCDTLIVKHNLFLNYVNTPRHYDIKKIEITNDGMCEGDCPKINIIINPKTFKSNGIKELDWEDSISTGQLTQNEIKNILFLLNYSNFSELKDKYEVGCTDQPTTILTISYDNGLLKKIHDYGSSGNFTLAEIYNIAYGIEWTIKK